MLCALRQTHYELYWGESYINYGTHMIPCIPRLAHDSVHRVERAVFPNLGFLVMYTRHTVVLLTWRSLIKKLMRTLIIL